MAAAIQNNMRDDDTESIDGIETPLIQREKRKSAPVPADRFESTQPQTKRFRTAGNIIFSSSDIEDVLPPRSNSEPGRKTQRRSSRNIPSNGPRSGENAPPQMVTIVQAAAKKRGRPRKNI
jgi:hypothetical protein